MFARNSRYRQVEDLFTTDRRGRTIAAKEIRLLPSVAGVLTHTLQASDRLDGLAYQYYQQPRKWWRICDANPDFLSPQALLGKEALTTIRFPLEFVGSEENRPWAKLLTLLAEEIAVEQVSVIDEMQWQDDRERPVIAILVEFNQLLLTLKQLVDQIALSGFKVLLPEPVGRIGKSIAIPSDN